MEITGIKYTAPLLDNSGYAQASRGNILALHELGVPLTLNPISFENIRPDLGRQGDLINSLIDKDIEYNINIIHTTPEFWEEHREENKLNVGYTIWETTKLHPKWPEYINNAVDAVMVGCDWNIDVFRDSGVKVPIFAVPHGISRDEFNGVNEFNVNGVSDTSYVFYSIFQWTERKHPLALIKAYWYAFKEKEDVALVLKTYRSDYSEEEKEAIRVTIRRLKTIIPLDNYPPIYLILNMLSNDEMLCLHARGDCYVSLDRGEGFGLSPFAAGACGNPIIVTGFGGITQYAKPNNSYLVDYSLTPVFGMPWSGSPTISIGCVDGYKKIKDVSEGDLVFNKNGNIKKVIKVADRPMLPDEKMHSILHYSMPTAIEVTNKHKLYVMREDNIVLSEAKDITSDDYLVVPKPKLFSEDISIDMIDYAVDNKWQEENGRLIYIRDVDTSNGIYRYLNLSKELFYLIGLYLAEGCVYSSNSCVSFSFNSNEIDTLARRCKECLKSVFGISAEHFYEREYVNRKGYELIVSNVLIGRFFRDEFGTGSQDKLIPYRWKLHKNKLYRECLLKGYWDGDGHIRKKGLRSGKNLQSPECIAETASENLFLSLRDLLISLNIVPSTRKSVRSDGRVSYIFSVSDPTFDLLFNINANRNESSSYKMKKNKYFLVRVKKNTIIKNYDDPVYSMSVEPDDDEDIKYGGSYILNGVASSNSPWYRGDQLWAEPDVKHGSDLMRHVFENQEEASSKGEVLQKYIYDNFAWEVIGQKIIDGIRELK
jgi:hypothetical protein